MYSVLRMLDSSRCICESLTFEFFSIILITVIDIILLLNVLRAVDTALVSIREVTLRRARG